MHVEHATPSSGSQSLEVNIGTITSGGGSQCLAYTMDNLRAMERMLTGHIGARHAKFWQPEPRGENWHDHEQRRVAARAACLAHASGHVVHGGAHAQRSRGTAQREGGRCVGHGQDDKGFSILLIVMFLFRLLSRDAFLSHSEAWA